MIGTRENTAGSWRPSISSQVDLKNVLALLKEFKQKKGRKVELILLGGLALHHYGMKGRATIDVDAEVKGDLQALMSFFQSKGIPSDLGEDISRWSLVSLPEGYRKRSLTIYKDHALCVKVLHPVDLVISKLRRFTDEDIEDALFVAKKFNVSAKQLESAKNKVLARSPKDTILFRFKKNVDFFIVKLLQQTRAR